MTTLLILDGTATAKIIRAEVAVGAKALTERTGIVPVLAAILAGDDPASATYVAMKERACARAGIGSRTSPFSADASEAEVADEVETEIAEERGIDRCRRHDLQQRVAIRG